MDDKGFGSIDAAPFWIGGAVTIVAAVITWLVTFNLETQFWSELDDASRKRNLQRLKRDFDTIQVVASLVSVALTELLVVHLGSTEATIAASVLTVLLIAALAVLLMISPAKYARWVRGPVTPASLALISLNLGGLLWAATR